MIDPEKNPGLLPPIPEEAAAGLPDPRHILSSEQETALLEQLRILGERRRNALPHFLKLPIIS